MLKATLKIPIKFVVGKNYNITHYFNNVKGKYEASEIIPCKYLGNREGWDKFLDPNLLDVISLHNNEYADESSDYCINWEKWTIDEFIEVPYSVEFKGSALMLSIKHPHKGISQESMISYEPQVRKAVIDFMGER